MASPGQSGTTSTTTRDDTANASSASSRIQESSLASSSRASKGVSSKQDISSSAMNRSAYMASAEDFMPNPVLHDENEQDHAEQVDEFQPSDPPRPDFQPLFTVVQDTTTGANLPHHPHVHYIFSDDDPEPVTHALLRTLDPSASLGSEHDAQTGRERIVLVDVANDGKTVTNAQSLSPDWQVTSTSVQTAPSFDDAAAPGEAALMLTITGTARPSLRSHALTEQEILAQARAKTEDDLFAALELVAEQYNQEMANLRKWSRIGGDMP